MFITMRQSHASHGLRWARWVCHVTLASSGSSQRLADQASAFRARELKRGTDVRESSKASNLRSLLPHFAICGITDDIIDALLTENQPWWSVSTVIGTRWGSEKLRPTSLV